jgi:hypothetical protein
VHIEFSCCQACNEILAGCCVARACEKEVVKREKEQTQDVHDVMSNYKFSHVKTVKKNEF